MLDIGTLDLGRWIRDVELTLDLGLCMLDIEGSPCLFVVYREVTRPTSLGPMSNVQKKSDFPLKNALCWAIEPNIGEGAVTVGMEAHREITALGMYWDFNLSSRTAIM